MVVFCQVMGLGLWPVGMAQAAPPRQIVTVREPTLRGALPLRNNAHYLGLEPTIRDGVITLTLAYDPQDNPNLRGFVNFLVLTEDGLRRFLAGEDPDTLEVAGGSPVPFDPIGNKMAVSFADSGRGSYTVIVYNNADVPVAYTLTAEGGILIDGANQTQTAAAVSAAPFLPTATPTATVAAASPAELSLLPGSVRARRVSGSLTRRAERHYLNLDPDIRDGAITFNFHYDPLGIRELIGSINFWILDEDGLRRMIAGSKPEDLNIATGFPVPFSPFSNELQANFTASGSNPYTVIVFNNSAISATYILTITGGVVIDQYVQTNEAKVAVAEQAALFNAQASATAAPTATPTPAPPTLSAPPDAGVTLISTSGETSEFALTPASTVGVDRLAGQLNQPYQHHYLGLTPEIRDGLIVVTLDFDPKDSQALAENINFWILDDQGLQRVLNGARPEDVGIATGSVVQYGADKGKLRAVINSSGRGEYTVVVYNNSDVPATYLLRANGGLLTDLIAQTTLP
jgi:hypothetical protein